MGEDIVQMSQKELTRVHVIRKVLDRSLTQREAGDKLNLSERQIRRLKTRVYAEGDQGLIHRSRGRPSQRKIADKLWRKILHLYRTVYHDFGPVFACEKLYKRDKIKISDESLRHKLIAEGLWVKHRKARKHRQWRERKHCRGEMVQLDGSHHAWFEARGANGVLMGYIDDASGNKSGQLYDHEGTLPALAGLEAYIRQNGVPLSVYVDKHTTYRATGKPTIEDELNNRFSLSQFERACAELGIKVIHAHSPQAKGRIERSFKTDQDRLVKELRLAGISTIKEANEFLKTYWPEHNKRFAVNPASEVDMHRPLPANIDLKKILCVKTERTVRNDFTILHEKKLYQILDNNCPRKVTVEDRIDGRMFISGGNRYLNFKPIAVKPVVKPEPKSGRIIIRPSIEHPWKRLLRVRNMAESRREALAAL